MFVIEDHRPLTELAALSEAFRSRASSIQAAASASALPAHSCYLTVRANGPFYRCDFSVHVAPASACQQENGHEAEGLLRVSRE